MINLNELAEKSGESYMKRPQVLNVPIVRLNGNEGTFVKSYFNQRELNQEELGTSIEGVILKVRRTLEFFSPKKRLFTNEHDGPFSYCSLFEKQGQDKPYLVEKGQSKMLKDKYGELKTHQVLYFLLNREVVKLDVKGGSLGNPKTDKGLYEYFRKFNNDEHIFEYRTLINSFYTQNDLGLKYYVMDFFKESKVENIEEVAQHIINIDQRLKAQEEFFARREKVIESPQEPVVQVEEEDEIKPEAIPF